MSDKPLAGVLVVNYNSSKIWDIVEKSIEGILRLEYRPLEIIFIDNGSNDDSFDRIRSLVGRIRMDDVRVKFIKLRKNFGFAGANTLGLKFISKKSVYVALINNDLAPAPDSLSKLTDYLDLHPNIAGVQGKVLSWEGDLIDSARCYLTDYGFVHNIGKYMPRDSVDKPYYVSYIDGCFSVYRVESIQRVGDLFKPYFFMYGEDAELGIRLWRMGFKLIYIPIVAGWHYRTASSKENGIKHEVSYSAIRNDYIIFLMYERYWLPKLLLRLPINIVSILMRKNSLLLRGLLDGIKVGLELRGKTKELRDSPNCEPRVKIGIVKYCSLLTRIFLLYGRNASKFLNGLLSKNIWINTEIFSRL